MNKEQKNTIVIFGALIGSLVLGIANNNSGVVLGIWGATIFLATILYEIKEEIIRIIKR